MIRLAAVGITFAIGGAFTAAPPANAQSPDPALLAPGLSGQVLAPPRFPSSRPSYASAGRRDVFRSRGGARLSHPTAHLH
jgi:hypothetical protein